MPKIDRQTLLDACQSLRKISAREVTLEQGDWSYLFLTGIARDSLAQIMERHPRVARAM